MEFAAGISVGVLIGLVIGIFLPELARRSNPDALPRATVREVQYLPAERYEPPPSPYCPPVIVLAAPRAKQPVALRVEPPGPPLLPQSGALARR